MTGYCAFLQYTKKRLCLGSVASAAAAEAVIDDEWSLFFALLWFSAIFFPNQSVAS